MNRWKKGLFAAVLCAVLALGIAPPASGATGTVYLMAVNDRVLMDLTAENMPTVMGGVLYVPYTMLSTRDTSINLGVNTMYSPTHRTLLVYDGQIGVEFDTQNNTAQDLQGNPVSARAMVRNNMAFLPIDYLCSFFGTINCARVYTDYGTLIRVTNNAAVLRDASFVAAAADQLAASLRGYLASVEELPPQPPSASTSSPPDPSDPPIQSEVLLALRWGSQGVEIAQMLESRRTRALFLFTCEELAAQEDAVRRIAAAGHTVGIALTGKDIGACAEQLKAGRQLLAEIARCPALIVSADALEAEGQALLEQEGCAVWRPELRGRNYRSGSELVEALNPQWANFVELECGQGSTAFFRGLMTAMEQESCYLRQASAPLLA